MGFSAEQVMSLVSLLVLLVFWLMILQNKRAKDQWLNDALLRRQEEIDAKKAQSQPQDQPEPQSDKEPTGPWG